MDQPTFTCTLPPQGWYCTRGLGHEGPCAAYMMGNSNYAPDMQAMVKEFMVACDQVIGDKPGLRDQLLRIRLILEEPQETVKAIYGGDMIEAIDGLADSLYVILGTCVAFGIDIYPFFEEVHRSNMAKRDPITGTIIKDLFGKVIKPVSWTPPDIKGVFESIYGDVKNYPSEQQSHENAWHRVIAEAEVHGYTPEKVMDMLFHTDRLRDL